MFEFWSAIIDRYIIIILAGLSAIMFMLRRQWENAATRFMVAIVYILAIIDLIPSSRSSMFAVRWSLILLFGVELLRYGLEKLFRRLRK
jgi:hypothetical protein